MFRIKVKILKLSTSILQFKLGEWPTRRSLHRLRELGRNCLGILCGTYASFPLLRKGS
jgi:hypothetical protein